MNDLFGKLYFDTQNKVILSKYNPAVDNYYYMVKARTSHGDKQIILTSDLMIYISQYMFLIEKFEIVDIEFMVDDSDLDENIKTILQRIRLNREYWVELKEKLEFLTKFNSIDIKKMRLRGNLNGSITEPKDIFITLQVNGILKISEKYYETKSEHIVRKVAEYFSK